MRHLRPASSLWLALVVALWCSAPAEAAGTRRERPLRLPRATGWASIVNAH